MRKTALILTLVVLPVLLSCGRSTADPKARTLIYLNSVIGSWADLAVSHQRLQEAKSQAEINQVLRGQIVGLLKAKDSIDTLDPKGVYPEAIEVANAVSDYCRQLAQAEANYLQPDAGQMGTSGRLNEFGEKEAAINQRLQEAFRRGNQQLIEKYDIQHRGLGQIIGVMDKN